MGSSPVFLERLLLGDTECQGQAVKNSVQPERVGLVELQMDPVWRGGRGTLVLLESAGWCYGPGHHLGLIGGRVEEVWV